MEQIVRLDGFQASFPWTSTPPSTPP
jgi:hypothetical protein